MGKVVPINSRAKGAQGEREFARHIHDQLGIRLVRNLEQTRSGGHDLVPAPHESGPVADTLHALAIEVKRHSKARNATIQGFWAQTRAQAKASGKTPVLAYREDRQPWRVVVPMYLVNPLLHKSHDLAWCATLSIEGFCCVIRERAFKWG